MPETSPVTMVVIILVSLGTIATMMSNGTRAEVLPDPQHCDMSGTPSCYSLGYSNGQAHTGTSYPSGHSSNYRDGWNSGAGNNNNNNLVMHNSPLIW